MTLRIPSLTAALAALAASGTALAHEGHGLNGPHWHATDAGVFVALLVAVGFAIWLGRRK